ncbi:MAG: HlyD family efflux transporter periplasmic adaptor subunit [Arcobacteraceae bacterium]|jgi:hypothetical protein|nr:HlyD family secretion protein [Arcobacteraceae bacterium]MDY0365772.1 HlyD family efflux transporter periplasmic adaptor subunit [Arcobacteraceae bacterium]
MKKLFVSLFLFYFVYASEYYAKLEPYDSFIVKAAVAGKIEYINLNTLGKIVDNETIIQMDDKLDNIELKYSMQKLQSLEEMLNIEEKNYDSIKNLSSKSLLEKDTQKIKTINIQTQVLDLKIKIATLQDKITNKKLIEQNKYIHEINVKVGEYVNAGTLLYSAMDFSKGKLEFFIPIEEANTIKEKLIYIDGEKTDLKINKLYQLADFTNISSYKCEIVLKNPNHFSKLHKIEFR